MSNSSDLTSSAAQGTIAALRQADDISEAGQGFRVLEFTPPVSSGARGGRGRGLVISFGAHHGRVVGSLEG
jgi:hypothetical protein